MAKETKVNSKHHFYKTLEEAISKTKPLPWKGIVPNNHEYFYQGVLTRQRTFKDMFSILMEHNHKWCPSVSGRSNGLAYLFLKMFDKDYANSIMRELPPINESNYKSINDFIKSFVSVSRTYYETSREINLIPYSHDFFSDTSVQYRKQQKIFIPYSELPSQYMPKSNKGVNRDYEGSNDERGYREANKQRLNYSHAYQDEFYDPNSEEEIDQIDEEHRQDDDNPDDIPLEDFIVNQLDEEEIQDTKLNAISNSKSNSKSDSNKVKTCYRYAIYGDCILGNKCPNVEGHNPNTAPAARRWLIDKLSRQMNQSNPANANGGPPKLWQRKDQH